MDTTTAEDSTNYMELSTKFTTPSKPTSFSSNDQTVTSRTTTVSAKESKPTVTSIKNGKKLMKLIVVTNIHP